jgi:hypothetical protein
MARGTLHGKKENGRNRNGTPHATNHYERTGRVHGPSLAEATLRDGWPPFVEKWWQTWREAPQAVAFEATDWLRLALLAPVYEAHLTRPSAAALAEIRMNEERLGATVVDRMRARMTIAPREDEATAPALGTVTSIGRKRADV